MMGIRRQTLQAVCNHFAQRTHVFVLGRQHADACRLFQHGFLRIDFEGHGVMPIGCSHFGFQHFPQGQHLFDLGFKRCGVKIGISDRHEQTFQHFMIDGAEFLDVEFAFNHDFGDALQRINQQILEFRHLFRFAADAANLAARPFGGFLTLVTKHAHLRFPLLFIPQTTTMINLP